ncbi:Hypothetical protein A7982_08187 [Minicystis rosea]|nr:Hypothetical protein A7982_08187 [Minicystis rosea]
MAAQHATRESLVSRGARRTSSRKQGQGSLAEALAYRNRDVVQRFLEAYPIDPADAEIIFTETKRWLWLAGRLGQRGGKGQLTVTQPMFALDEMWHCFIVFTRDYAEFCARFVGHYIHHQPVTLAEKARARRHRERDPEGFARAFARKMERQYTWIAEQLGEDTLRAWHVEIPAKYPMSTLQRLNAEAAVAHRYE